MRTVLLALCALVAVPAFAGAAEAAKKQKKGVNVGVMTRNVFLGADLTPALQASGAQQFIAANGGILREVTATNFPLRAQGLATEIAQRKPHLVGLQEVALWRTGPPNVAPALDPNAPKTATEVRYDFLELLMDQLAQRGQRYRVAVVNEEFDFEAPADENGDPNDGFLGGEINGRLTMRDVILVRKGGPTKVKIKNPSTGHYTNLYTPRVANVRDVPVTRGWTALDATVTKGKGKKRQKVKFRFVNTHLEAFDDETQRPSIRALQAQEVVNGPASKKRTILVGDLNSDVPGLKPGDEQAFQTVLDAGFRDIGTTKPMSCCVSNLFSSPPSEFDHRVDQIVTNMPKKKVKRLNSKVTGLAPMNGIYDSDHAGVYSKLKIRK